MANKVKDNLKQLALEKLTLYGVRGKTGKRTVGLFALDFFFFLWILGQGGICKAEIPYSGGEAVAQAVQRAVGTPSL